MARYVRYEPDDAERDEAERFLGLMYSKTPTSSHFIGLKKIAARKQEKNENMGGNTHTEEKCIIKQK